MSSLWHEAADPAAPMVERTQRGHAAMAESDPTTDFAPLVSQTAATLDSERFRSAPRTGCAFHRQAGSAANRLRHGGRRLVYDRRR